MTLKDHNIFEAYFEVQFYIVAKLNHPKLYHVQRGFLMEFGSTLLESIFIVEITTSSNILREVYHTIN